MPELPEVETIRRYIAPYLAGEKICCIVVRAEKLRLPIPPRLREQISGRRITAVERRGKYLLVRCSAGNLVIHLGMTGNLRLVPFNTPPGKHDHVDFILESGNCLRFTDSRRFGTILWTESDPLQHPLIAIMGPEPLESSFTGEYLYAKCRGRKSAIKQLLMNSRIVAGIGNIYAGEALFRAGLHPEAAAGALSLAQCCRLADAIKEVLHDAVACGEKSLAEPSGEDMGGYFPYQFSVYAREGSPCPGCGKAIIKLRQGGRSSFFCSNCQRLTAI